MNTRFLYLITGSSQSVSIYRWEIEAKISVSVSISRFLRLRPLLYVSCVCSLCAVLWLSCCTTQLLQTSRITSILTPVPLLTYKDPHTVSPFWLSVFYMCVHTVQLSARAARHTLLRSSACRTSGSLVAAVAFVRSARAGFFERAVCLYNAAEKVARRRSTSRAELHHLRAVPDDEVQRRR